MTVAPGQVIFSQGDRSNAFYLVQDGEVQMSLTPERDADDDRAPALIPVRKYIAGDCFGASGLIEGAEGAEAYRRNTATALTTVKLKIIPHKHFSVMLKDDAFLKAGLQATELYSNKMQAAAQNDGLARGVLVPTEIFDEMEDEVVAKAMKR